MSDEIVKLPFEVFDVAGELPVLQKTVRKIADDERRRLPIELTVHFVAGFSRRFFLPFQERRRDKRRRSLRLFIVRVRRAQVSMKDFHLFVFLTRSDLPFVRPGAVSLSLTTSISIRRPRAKPSLTLLRR